MREASLRERGSGKRVCTRLRAGVVQVDATPGDLKTNILQVHRLLGQYRGELELLVLPEYGLTGYLNSREALQQLSNWTARNSARSTSSCSGASDGSFRPSSGHGRFSPPGPNDLLHPAPPETTPFSPKHAG